MVAESALVWLIKALIDSIEDRSYPLGSGFNSAIIERTRVSSAALRSIIRSAAILTGGAVPFSATWYENSELPIGKVT